MEEKKGNAATRAKNKYKDKTYDRLELVVPKGNKEKIREFAKSKDKSVNSFIVELIDAAMAVGGILHFERVEENPKEV